MTIKTTTNAGKNKKCIRKGREESVSEDSIYDPLNVFYKPMGAIKIRSTC